MPDSMLHQRYVTMTNGGFYTWDVSKNTFWADDKFAQIMGLTPEELDAGLPAERMMELIHEEDRPLVVEGIKKSVLSGEPFEMVYRILRDNKYVKVVEYGNCFRYADGVATLFTGIVFDACLKLSGESAASANTP